MRTKAVIGLDTSNYTTSCAICNTEGKILENIKLLLPVKAGEKGLRQSDAVFSHIKNFQKVSDILKEKQCTYEFIAIGYSAYPRDNEGSYMPCFLVGQAIAEMVSALLNIPSYRFSHQGGHIQAALYSGCADLSEDFVAFHVSGGTTEVLYVSPDTNGFKINKIGCCNDLHAGQVIDRVGVSLGLNFPCGRAMEELALEYGDSIPKPKTSVEGFSCNLSGLENLAKKLFIQTNSPHATSRYVFEFIADTIIKITGNLRNTYKNIPIVYAGGVMSNSLIKNKIQSSFKNVYFAKPEFSTDNASGVALLTLKKLN